MKLFAPAGLGLLLALAHNAADAALPKEVAALIDTTVDPCTNFYQYACGQFNKTATIPQGKRRAAYGWDDLQNKAEAMFTAVLAEKNLPVLSDYYASCMDTNTINALGNKPLQRRLQRIDATQTKPELAHLVGELATSSSWMFVDATTGFGGAPSDLELVIENLQLPFDQGVFLDPTKLSAERPRMREYIGKALDLAGVKTSSGKSVNMTAAADMIIDTYKKTVDLRPTDDELNNDDTTLSHSEALKRYPLSYKGMIEGTGLKMNPNRDSFCKKDVIDRMPHLATQYIYAQYFSDDRRAYLQNMAALIKQAMQTELKNATWLDASTRKEAIAKVGRVVTLFGKSPQYSTPPVKVQATTFFDNVIALKTWNFHNDYFANVGKQPDQQMWTLHPADVTTFFLLFQNSAQYTVGILQQPFFNLKQHPAQNFGSTGTLIAGDLTKPVSVFGRQVDQFGHQRDWFSEKDNAAYSSRAQCMSDQYSAQVLYDSNGKPLGHEDGSATVENNVVINNAVNLALVALHDWMKKNPSFPTNGVSADEVDKLYYLSFAQTSCYKGTDAWLKDQLENGVPEFSVNVPMMNSDAFATTFGCKAGTNMNPAKKCHVW
ncbi:ATP-binding Cassette (ABC) Superfamily [Phytophthora nicotianae]|uniref:ATP-binding Cassette (ABC) Superfamily n=1 Tax=Phytophthora nicotianae TaxID=4792 RepID=A0A0W8DS15_PHYNI|nr:ATP-binding Cassette (ABC) Superfamily [Phytophthora nicotianae]